MKSCNSCGKCCTKYGGGGLSASSEEIEEWELNYPEIFQYVRNGEIWADPQSGALLERCPFLYSDTSSRKMLCKIYRQRPEDCRFYPSTVSEMITDDCEMIELKDLRNPKQAKKDLKELMRDSHIAD